ncbi:MAG: nicotinate-nucleotide adenylyltransferase [Bacteroidota bacterium]
MKLGIFGGSFNPPHIGHLIIAESVREKLQLDNVIFVPAGQPPHKSSQPMLEAMLRLKLLQLAIASQPQFIIDEIELQRIGLSYSVETLQYFAKKYPHDALYFLIGADSFLELHTWKSPKEICSLATVVVMNRGGIEIKNETEFTRLVQFVRVPNIEISSTEIRQRVAMGKSIRYLVTPSVEEYITTHAIYK